MGVRFGPKVVRRAGTWLALVGLLGGATAVAAAPAQAAVGGELPDVLQGVDPSDWDESAGPEPIPWKESNLGWPGGPEPEATPDEAPVEFPDADAWDVTLGDPGEVASESGRGSGNPVRVATPAADASGLQPGAAEAAGGKTLKLQILDRDVAERAGASGFVFTVEGAEAGTAPDAPVELEIDYSGFAQAYGGDYAQRLQVVALPGCVLESPRPAGCQATPKPLNVKNLGNEQRLVVDAADLGALAPAVADTPDDAAVAALERSLANASLEFEADVAAEAATQRPQGSQVPEELAPWESSESAGNPAAAAAEEVSSAGDEVDAAAASGAMVLAVTAAASGDMGSYAASPLSSTGQWNVAPGSGEFAYDYPIDVPAPGAGSAPSVGLGYSSGSIDGMTIGTNNQAGQAGLGWSEFGNAFIERHYEPCYMGDSPVVGTWPDLCFEKSYHGATISLGPVSGLLVPTSTDERQFRLKNDPGWKIERLGDALTGENWKVTGPDGTQYSFGLYKDPETNEGTWSTYWAPVISDDTGEPCWGSDTAGQPAACNLGWRWNLDRVVDPDGNVTMYYYNRESNWYTSCLGFCANDRSGYMRAGMLSRIEYGRRVGSDAQAAGKVTFGAQYRCKYLDTRWQDSNGDGNPDRNGSDCPVANTSPASSDLFPDVPNDLLCTQTACNPIAISPAFFSARRYSHVRTEVLVGNEYRPVAQHNLYGGFGALGDWKLGIVQIQNAAISQGGLDAHSTFFQSTGGLLDNRVDHDPADDATRMRHYRITKVVTPFGGTIDVTYGQQNACDSTYSPEWDDNVKDCFPQTIRETGSSFPTTGLFHKWLVTKVVESSAVIFANMPRTATETNYSYEGAPAWAYDVGAFARGESDRGWSAWRGYGTVTVTKGDSTTRLRVFRGMDGDREMEWLNGQHVPTGTRSVPITSFDGSYSTMDSPSLLGRTLEEEQPQSWRYGTPEDGVTTDRATSTSSLYKYETAPTATVPQGWEAPVWAGLTETVETTKLETEVCNPNCTTTTESKQRGSNTVYNTDRQPWKTVERGWLDTPDDDRCSITTYAVNTAAGMVNYPASNTVREGANCDGTVLSQSQTLYDNTLTAGAAPTRGNVTLQRAQIDATRWAETGTEYDPLGRPTKVTGPSGAVTTTVYTPALASASPTKLEVTSSGTGVPSLKTTTELLPEFGVPTKVTDPNLNVTTYGYDTWGRADWVRSPTEQNTTDSPEPTVKFAYRIDWDDASDSDLLPEEAPIVRTRELLEGSGSSQLFQDTFVVYDGFLRERQTQTPTVGGGKMLVATTSYDDRGLVYDEIAPEAVTLAPWAGYGVPAGGAAWQNRTRHSYDELGRDIRSEWRQGTTVQHATTSDFGLDTVTATGPDGVAVTETVDGLGRTVRVEENGGAASSYVYDLAGNLQDVTDPAGNVTSYDYNLAGWRTGQTDPDRGVASFAYDVTGLQTMAQDAAGQQIHTTYDVAGRPKERHADSPTGTSLASWSYDTATNGLGLAASATRRTTGGDWVSAVTGYDAKGRALGSTLTLPAAGVPGLAPSYTVTQTHDRADRPASVTYPAVAGGLAQETVTTAYNGYGLPATMKATSGYSTEYVWAAANDDRLRPTFTVIGPKNTSHGYGWGLVKINEFDADQQLDRSYMYNSWSALPGGIIADNEVSFRDDGQVTARDSVLGGDSWRECNGYDARARLTSTYTVANGADCTEANKGGGDQPFERSYTYSPDGKLEERTEDGVATGYTYPTGGAGSVRPHAPSMVGTQDYTWNSDGSLDTRAVAGGSETFNWDTEHLLSSIDAPGGSTSFVYAPDGSRLMRTAPDGSHTLYFAGHEVTADAAGTSVTGVRSYSFGGQLVATRSSTGVDYMVSDAAGSVQGSIASGAADLSGSRRYDPYGQARAETGSGFETDRGFIGQVEDASTGLSYLNARYYDAEAALFVSADPLFDTARPKSLNPYTYGFNNPVGFSDPSGMMSSSVWGLAHENGVLRGQVKQLQGIVTQLGAQITEMQGIIKDQQRALNEAYTYISALQAQIRAMQDYIGQLQSRVRYLQGRVAYWRGQATYWRGQASYWKGQATYWKGQATYWKGQADLWKGRATGYELQSYVYHLYGDKFGFDASRIDRIIAYNPNTTASLDGGMGAIALVDHYEGSLTSGGGNRNDGSAPEGDNWDWGEMSESVAKDATLGAAFGCGTGVVGGGAGCVPGALAGGALGAAQSVIHYAWDQWW